MATEVIAPAPPGVQSTFDKPLGPQPAKTRVGDKFREEFAKLTKPQQTEESKDEPTTEKTSDEIPKQEPVQERSPETVDKPVPKAASPLDAILETAITGKDVKEEKSSEESDVLKEFDEKTANWQRAREVMKTQSGELKTLREKVQTLEKTPKAEPSVIESLTKERDDLLTRFQQQEERLKAINAEYSEPFQNLLAAKDKDVTKLSNRMKALGGDAETLVGALSLPEGKVRTAQIKEAMAELDPDDKITIRALIEKIEGHDDTIADFRKDLPKKWDELQAQRDVQLAEQSQAAVKQLETQYGKVIETIPTSTVTLREVADDVPGGTEWNQEIRSAIETGLKVLKPDGADFNQSVEIAVKGARYDTLEKRYLALHSDYSDLKKQYNELAGSGPDFKGGTKPVSTVDKKPGIKYREALAIAQGAGVGEV
jgi:chromosome segregation ATPase